MVLRCLLSVLLVFVQLGVCLAASKDAERLVRLENGLTIYTIKDTRFPLVATRLFVNTGSSHESLDQAGISHVLEHMVFKGTSERPKGQVAKDVESLGGYVNAATSFDRTWYVTDLPKQYWKVGIDIVKDMAFNALLDAKELEPEKDVIVSELQGGDDSPQHKLFEELQKATLANTPYGHPIIGSEKTIRAVTRESLVAYRDYWYQPQNMALLVAGDIDPDQVLSYAKTLFTDVKNTHVEDALPEVVLGNAKTERVAVLDGPWKKVYLGFAFPAPALTDLRSVDLDVLSYLLGGDATSYFYRKYKYEKELVDSITVNNMSLARAGLLSIHVQLDVDKVAPFLTAFTKDLATLHAGLFSKDELARAVFNLEDSLNKAGETLSGLAAWKGTVAFQLGGSIGEQNIRDRLAGMNADRIAQSLKTWFDPNHLRLRVLAPKGAKLPDCAGILQSTWPATQKAQTGKPQYMEGAAERVDLPNNCVLLLRPDTHTPYMALSLTRFGGNALLDAKHQGLAHLTAALLSDGVGSMDAQAFEAYLAARAITMDASASRQLFTLALEGPSRFEKDMYSLLTLTLVSPRFEEREIAREITTMRALLRQREDHPMRYLFSKINPMLYPNHPYGYDELGSEALLATYTQKQVKEYWAKQTQQPWVLSCVGSFSREAIIDFAKTLASRLTQAKPSLPEPHFGTQSQLALPLPGRAQAHLVKIFPSVGLGHPDTPALMVLANILSGQSGVLFTNMRDKEGLGYTVTAFQRSLPASGAFFFYIGTVPEKIAKAEEGFTRVIADICQHPRSPEELTSAVNRLLGDYIRQTQSLSSRSEEAGKNAILGFPVDFRMQLIERARSLTPEMVRDVAKRYFDKQAYTVTLGAK
ncbi:MAG: insulinase family protein [Desulfovibrio sp.]|nr:insulinase family protein [Desulfovibrio sp.]